jgi:imidazolonepropionase-like amidohydrolase
MIKISSLAFVLFGLTLSSPAWSEAPAVAQLKAEAAKAQLEVDAHAEESRILEAPARAAEIAAMKETDEALRVLTYAKARLDTAISEEKSAQLTVEEDPKAYEASKAEVVAARTARDAAVPIAFAANAKFKAAHDVWRAIAAPRLAREAKAKELAQRAALTEGASARR